LRTTVLAERHSMGFLWKCVMKLRNYIGFNESELTVTDFMECGNVQAFLKWTVYCSENQQKVILITFGVCTIGISSLRSPPAHLVN